MNSSFGTTSGTSIKPVSDIGECSPNDGVDLKSVLNQNVFDVMPVVIPVFENLSGKTVNITFVSLVEAAKGSFGTVYDGVLNDSLRVAVKRVLQDRKYKNRELTIMRLLNHNHVTSLLHFFFTSTNNTEIYLNLVMEFIPQTLSRILKFYYQTKSYLPMEYVKVYIFQLFRGLNYMHQLGFCHRDIKPQNILLDPQKALLRICDFGSAKKLIKTEKNISYICSRYYRAPELIFGATEYTTAIDVWSAGCVFSEVLLNRPLFHGDTSVEQIVEIIKILGTPTKENVMDMNPNYTSYQLPPVEPCAFNEIFTNSLIPEEAFQLLKDTFRYSPQNRLTSLEVLAHSFFDNLRSSSFTLNSNRGFPPMFDFEEIEIMNADQSLKEKLISFNQN